MITRRGRIRKKRESSWCLYLPQVPGKGSGVTVPRCSKPSLPTHLCHSGYDKGFEKPFPKLYLNGRQWTSRFLELSTYLPFKISLNSLSFHTQSFVLPPHFPLVSLRVHGTPLFPFFSLRELSCPDCRFYRQSPDAPKPSK